MRLSDFPVMLVPGQREPIDCDVSPATWAGMRACGVDTGTCRSLRTVDYQAMWLRPVGTWNSVNRALGVRGLILVYPLCTRGMVVLLAYGSTRDSREILLTHVSYGRNKLSDFGSSYFTLRDLVRLGEHIGSLNVVEGSRMSF
jgi:hypothetical protein